MDMEVGTYKHRYGYKNVDPDTYEHRPKHIWTLLRAHMNIHLDT